jgi:hypothetical protein
MLKAKPDKRTRLIQTAVKLAYRRGFRTTSLAERKGKTAHGGYERPRAGEGTGGRGIDH